MKEFLLYINILKSIIDRYYGRETVFYDDGEWYSREHSCIISQEELTKWILELTEHKED